jgi:hypothetical protein
MSTSRRALLLAAGVVIGGCAPAADPDPMVDPYAACYGDEERAACFRKVERTQLRAARGRVVRDGPVLRITPAEGEPVVLRDDTADVDRLERFRYRAFLREAGHHLVKVSFYEGDAHLLVSDRTGSQTYLPAAPLFSPDGARFASVSMDLDAFHNANAVQVWQASREKPVLEWQLDLNRELGQRAWGPSDARWIDGRTLELVKNEPTDSPYERRRSRMRLRLRDGRWVLEALPGPVEVVFQ